MATNREGLPEIAETARSAEAREIALIALAHGFSLGSLAREFNERYSMHGVAANISRLLSAERMRPDSVQRFAGVLGIEAEHLLATGSALIPERYEYWWERALKQMDVADGGAFKAGTLLKLQRARDTSPDLATTATHVYALATYRMHHGVYKGKGRFGTSLFELSPSYRALAPEFDFVRRIAGAIDLIKLRKTPSTRDDALANVFVALHGLVPDETCDAIVVLCRTALLAAGHNLAEKEFRLQRTVQAFREKTE